MNRRASATAIVACAVAIAATACATILGIDDVTVKDAGISLDDAAPDGATSDASSALDPYARVVLSDAPVAYWRLGDVGTVAVDSSPNGIDGTYGPGIIPGPPIVSGTTGGSADFPGSPDGGLFGFGITVPPNPKLEPLNEITIEAWIRPFAGNMSQLVSYGQQTQAPYQPWTLQSPPLELFTSCCGDVFGNSALVPNNTKTATYYVAATFDHSVGTILYVNGVHDGEGGTGGMLGGYDKVYGLGIGAGFTGDLPFTGLIDEVAIYDKALSADRILAHYNAGK